MRIHGLPARTLAAALAAAAAALALAAPAAARTPFLLGIADDGLKDNPTQTAEAARGAGVGAFRIILRWSRGETAVSPFDRLELDRAASQSGSFRIVLAVTGRTGADAPRTDADRRDYCAYVRNAIAPYPAIRDVVIWNEVNKQMFWRPQYSDGGESAAPAAYVALLAHCYDSLHAFRPGMNVVTSMSARGNDNPNASSNVSHSPVRFVLAMGEAYRRSGRTRPIFDTIGHHPYGEHSRERPYRRHPLSLTIGQGDWDKLLQALHDGFRASRQPVPGRCVEGKCAPIWYTEIGYQTTVDPAVASIYRGAENVEHVVPWSGPGDPPGATPDEKSLAPDHVTQLRDAIRLAYCQPYVEAYFNFLLRDEPDLAGWQSGLLWADWRPKPAYAAYAALAAEVASGTIDCSRPPGSPAPSAGSGGSSSGPSASSGQTRSASLGTPFPLPRTDVQILRTEWPKARRFNWRNDLWRFRIAAAEDAVVEAVVVDLGRSGKARKGRRVLRARGNLRLAYMSFVTFKRSRLKAGRHYRIEVRVTSKASSLRTTRLASPRFFVSPPVRR
jgi:hypothetical protein